MVDDLQNKNQELMKQIEICQEENKILDKLHQQKVAEVEKLTQTVRQLEEAVLAGGGAANAVRDYQQKVQEMNEERKTLDRELARAKVNRVATVVANEWKDANDKVMPVKQWLEERRFLQVIRGEQRLTLHKVQLHMLGTAKKVTVSLDDMIIVHSGGDKKMKPWISSFELPILISSHHALNPWNEYFGSRSVE